MTPLPLNSTIGILGGGQLGRMLALAAARLGFRTHIYCPDPQSPAFEVTPHKTVAAYDDEAALAGFEDATEHGFGGGDGSRMTVYWSGRKK